MTVSYTNEHTGSRNWWQAMMRGFAKQCPRCGHGKLFSGFMTNRATCTECNLDFNGHRADDGPPYITIMIVGHVMIPLALFTRQLFEPALWLQFAIWLPLILIATVMLMPRSKGAMIGIQWANEMHGFGEDANDRPEDEIADLR